MVLTVVGVALAAGAVTTGRWLPWLVSTISFLETNSETIGAVSGIVTICQGLSSVVLLVLGYLGLRKRQQVDSNTPARDSVNQGDRSVHAGRDILGPVFTGETTVQLSQPNDYAGPGVSGNRQAALGLVPAAPEVLVGRERDLAEIKQRLIVAREEAEEASRSGDFMALYGWPGVGKTALTTALANDPEVHEMFPDGVLFKSLGKHPDIFSTLAEWARAAGAGDLSGAVTVEEAAGRLRVAMKNKRVLAIVDDVWDATHALPLVIGGGRCATLATTRLEGVAREFSPGTAGIYRLGVLREEDALRLLVQLAPQVVEDHPEDSRRLVQTLDGLPLAVRIAGGLLAAEASMGLDVRTLLNELRQTERLLEEDAPPAYAFVLGEVPVTVAALLRRSTEGLSEKYRRRFALLGVLPPRPVSFDASAAQHIWDMRSDPQMTLRALVNRGLLEPAGNGRFQMHSVLSAFAASMSEEEPEFPDPVTVHLRRLRHYEIKLGSANEAFAEGGNLQRQGLGVFDEDRECIRDAYEWATSRIDENEEAARYVTRYAQAGARLLSFRLPAREFIRWMESARRAAVRLQDENSLEVIEANIGTGYLMAGAYTEALPYGESALDSARNSGDAEAEAAALGNLASIYAAIGELQSAKDYAEGCVKVARNLDDREVEAKAVGTLGEMYAELGRPRDAVGLLKAQRDIARRIEDSPSEARALRRLGIFYRELGHPWRAAILFDASARLFENLGDNVSARGVLLGYGLLCVKQESHNEALALFDRVLASAVEDDDGAAQATALMNKGNVQYDLNRPELSQELYRQARDIANKGPHAGVLGDASWNLAMKLEAAEDRRGAVGAARDAFAAYRSVGNPRASEVEQWLNDQGMGLEGS